MERFLERYGLLFGGEVQEIIESDDGRTFIDSSFEYTSKMFFDHTLHSLPQNLFDLNVTILRTVTESAFIDLYQATLIHELRDAPSAQRKGAALICWINRLKPIQVVKDEGDSRIILINAVFALHVGWTLAWQIQQDESSHTKDYSDDLKERLKSPAIFGEVIESHHLSNDLVYHLMWRNPGFKELTLLLQSLTAQSSV